eukprot:5067958-Pleurochrysis_carterae.AAC.2
MGLLPLWGEWVVWAPEVAPGEVGMGAERAMEEEPEAWDAVGRSGCRSGRKIGGGKDGGSAGWSAGCGGDIDAMRGGRHKCAVGVSVGGSVAVPKVRVGDSREVAAVVEDELGAREEHAQKVDTLTKDLVCQIWLAYKRRVDLLEAEDPRRKQMYGRSKEL